MKEITRDERRETFEKDSPWRYNFHFLPTEFQAIIPTVCLIL
jgi:hypothetical protein